MQMAAIFQIQWRRTFKNTFETVFTYYKERAVPVTCIWIGLILKLLSSHCLVHAPRVKFLYYTSSIPYMSDL